MKPFVNFDDAVSFAAPRSPASCFVIPIHHKPLYISNCTKNDAQRSFSPRPHNNVSTIGRRRAWSWRNGLGLNPPNLHNLVSCYKTQGRRRGEKVHNLVTI